MLFLGTYDYAPNREAIQFLIDRVLPVVTEFNAEIWIVGRGMEAVEEQEGMRVIGYQKSLDEIYASVDLVVVPLLS